MALNASIGVVLPDGSTVRAPFDPDASKLTADDWRLVGELDSQILGDVDDELAVTAAILFVNLRRHVPAADWETFGPFAVAFLTGGVVLELEDGPP